MDINQKTAKVPLWILYGLLAAVTILDFVCAYLSLRNNPSPHQSNPVYAYLASTIGPEYLLFMIPILLVVFYGGIRLGGWTIRRMDKRSEISGENYMAVIFILLTFPSFFTNGIFPFLFNRPPLRLVFDPALIIGIVLFAIYIVVTDAADRKFKKKHMEIARPQVSI